MPIDNFATIEEFADAENMNRSQVSRVLRMTLQAPKTVEAILAGRQPVGLTKAQARQRFLSHGLISAQMLGIQHSRELR